MRQVHICRSRRAILAAGVVLSMALAGLPGEAAYLESDAVGPDPAPERAPVPVPPWPEPGPRDVVRIFLRELDVAPPFTRDRLTLYPVVTRRPARLDDVATLREAQTRGWITISENGPGDVAESCIINHGPMHVLAMAGEIIAGGKQNRTVRRDVLVPPRTREIIVPVMCVEQHRWTGRDTTFRVPGTAVPPSLRRSVAGEGRQEQVWREIDAARAATGVEATTGDLQAVYDDPRARDVLSRVAAEFQKVCPSRTVGVVGALGDRILVVDLFGDADLFDRARDALCLSYALECLVREGAPDDAWRGGARPRPPIAPDASIVRRFLDDVGGAEFAPVFTPGAGTLLEVRGAAQGHALVWQGQVVHTAFYP